MFITHSRYFKKRLSSLFEQNDKQKSIQTIYRMVCECEYIVIVYVNVRYCYCVLLCALCSFTHLTSMYSMWTVCFVVRLTIVSCCGCQIACYDIPNHI